MLPHLACTEHQLYATSSEILLFNGLALFKALDTIKDIFQKDILNTNLKGTDNVKVYIDASKHAICIVVTKNEKLSLVSQWFAAPHGLLLKESNLLWPRD